MRSGMVGRLMDYRGASRNEVRWFFACEVCQRVTPPERGCADDMPDACDDCWAAAHPEVA